MPFQLRALSSQRLKPTLALWVLSLVLSRSCARSILTEPHDTKNQTEVGRADIRTRTEQFCLTKATEHVAFVQRQAAYFKEGYNPTSALIRDDPKTAYNSNSSSYTLSRRGAADHAADTTKAVQERQKLEDQMDVIDSAIQALEDAWPVPGGRAKEFLEAPWGYPTSDKGQALQAKLRARWKNREPFVFASLGSSVTAGHDNYWNQSWPFELERLLSPSFKSMGFDFSVRQRATGGYGEMPYTVGCLETRVGKGVDATNWEWGMFNDDKCEVQQFITEANRLERKPVVFGFQDCSLYDDGNTKRKDRAEKQRKRLLQHAETELGEGHWHPNEWYLTEEYISKAEIKNWAAQPTALTPEEVTETGASGETQQYLEKIGLAKQFATNGQGWYPLKVSFAAPMVKADPWFATRERAFNINWHPGPLGHRLVANVLGHFFLKNLRAVVYGELNPGALIEDDPTAKKAHTGWNPVVNHASESPANGTCGSLRTTRCFTGQMPRRDEPGYGLEALVQSNPTKWKLGQSIQAPVETEMPQLDLRKTFSGSQKDGELLMTLTVPDHSGDQYALLCQAPCGWDCKEHTGFISISGSRRWKRTGVHSQRSNSSDAVFTVDGQRISDEALASLHQNLFAPGSGEYCPGCKGAGDVCQPVAKLSPGQHKIGMSVRPDVESGTLLELIQVMLVGSTPQPTPGQFSKAILVERHRSN